MDGKCVDAAFELLGKERVDRTVTLETRLAFEGCRNDDYPEMALARTGRGAVTGVLLAFVNHVETGRFEADHELFTYGGLDCHIVSSMSVLRFVATSTSCQLWQNEYYARCVEAIRTATLV